MVFWNSKSKRKKTGGVLKPGHKKKKYQRGGTFKAPKIGEEIISSRRVRGGKDKTAVIIAEFVNVGKKKLKIVQVSENKSNFRFNRAKIITKGAILETEKGMVRVTSRPGQDGTINGVFVEAKK
ncbi:MAG: 30S ribosomal protein S8e [Candidatus Aenigmarchaeota archaeon]|nr:30S ribosomal protein S8e [Candidatus Aenigmarchaeota archaeon]